MLGHFLPLISGPAESTEICGGMKYQVGKLSGSDSFAGSSQGVDSYAGLCILEWRVQDLILNV